MVEKIRASRNRTLTILENEAELYASSIVRDISEIMTIDQIVNKTINNNLLDVLDYLPESFADLIIIDPPYNLTKDFNGSTFKLMTNEDYSAYLSTWFRRVVTKLKPNGSLYICGDWRSTSALQHILSQHLHILNRITWQREKGRGAKANWKNAMEDIWFGVSNPNDYYFDVEAVKVKRKVIAPYRVDGAPKDWEESKDGKYRLTYPSNIWDDISIPYWSMPENTDHPTQKPEKLIAKLILASCPKGGIVFDPFLGSGTSSVVAKKLGRKYVGIELDYEYCLWAEKRLKMAETDDRIQGYEDGIFWERNSQRYTKKKSNGSLRLL